MAPRKSFVTQLIDTHLKNKEAKRNEDERRRRHLAAESIRQQKAARYR